MSRIADIAKTMKTWWNKDDDPFVHRALDEIIRIDQEQLPTIEPKQGEWIGKAVFHNRADEPFVEKWQSTMCSVCHKYHTTPYIHYFNNYNFCPNCGVRMKGANDD